MQACILMCVGVLTVLFLWLFLFVCFVPFCFAVVVACLFANERKKKRKKEFGGWGGKGDLERAGG